MKKVLVTLLVFAVAVSGVFAAVNFGGTLQSGYVIQYADDNWTSKIFGEDNTDSNSTKLTLNFGDDNGYWSATMEGVLFLDGSSASSFDGNGTKNLAQNRVVGDITVDLAKIIAGPETDWSAQIQLLAYDRITALRAYTNKSGLNYDRVRTAEPGLWANAIIGYGKLIQFQVGGAPALTGTANNANETDDGGNKKQQGDVIISAMTEPLDGLRVSVDWAWKGDSIGYNTSHEVETIGVVGGAADVNIGALAGLDFDLGVGVADKYYYGKQENTLAAQVYGGVDFISGFVEFVWDDKGTAADEYRLHLGLDLNVVESMILNFYGGVGNFKAAADQWYVGGNIGYEVAGVTFQLNLQYAAYETAGESYMNSVGGDIAQGAVKASGFSITPMIKVAF